MVQSALQQWVSCIFPGLLIIKCERTYIKDTNYGV